MKYGILPLQHLTSTCIDSYRLHPRPPSARSLEIGPSGRNVFPPLASTRTSHETNRLGHQGSAEPPRCRCCHGIIASLHGDARRSKDHQHHHNKLYAGLHAHKCQNPRGIFDTSQPQISTSATLMISVVSWVYFKRSFLCHSFFLSQQSLKNGVMAGPLNRILAGILLSCSFLSFISSGRC